MVFFY